MLCYYYNDEGIELSEKTKRENIKNDIKYLLWAMNAGRCQKCGRLLYKHPLSDAIGNFSQIAHNLPVGLKGPRCQYKLIDEKLDINDITNLLMLCYDCHHEIDNIRPNDFPPSILKQIKYDFEEFVFKATNINNTKGTTAIFYSPNLHGHQLIVVGAQKALFPEKYIENQIDISNCGNTLSPNDTEYWIVEEKNLVNNFNKKVKSLMDDIEKPYKNFSVFAFGPIPLLAKLGELLTNKYNIEVYQLKKAPLQTWEWETGNKIDYNLHIGQVFPDADDIQLILSLSGKIRKEEADDVLKGKKFSSYEISIADPFDDYLRSREHLSNFISVYQKLKELIRSQHKKNAMVHVFAAVPASVAIEIGRHRNPSFDLPMTIYNYSKDQNNYTKGIILGEKHNERDN